MTEGLKTISEMCADFDVTARTLRFYEAKELLSPIREGSRRLFTKRDRARLKLIIMGKRFGVSLEETRHLLNLYDIGDQQLTQLQQTYALAVERRGIMEAQRDELTAALGDLDDQLAYVADILADRGVTAAPIAKKTASAR